MTHLIHKIGFVGSVLAILLVGGLNIVAIEKQWEVPYIGIQKAYAASQCESGNCCRTDGSQIYGCKKGCWNVGHNVANPCAQSCNDC